MQEIDPPNTPRQFGAPPENRHRGRHRCDHSVDGGGKIVRTVVEAARQEGANLAIVGRGSATQPFGDFGHAVGIIQRSLCLFSA
jgi:hypothetical protein